MRLVLACVIGIIVIHSSAAAYTYFEWLQQPEAKKNGYVGGVMQSLAQLVEPNCKESRATATAYQKCFQENKILSNTGLTIVENHLRRDPLAATTEMFGNTVTALAQACKKYMPQ